MSEAPHRGAPALPWRRAGAVALAALVVALAAAASAFADGDPASDTLVGDDVFFSYTAPSQASAASLQSQLRHAHARGFRLKVAVIATPVDLGAIPSLFGKPDRYAAFLGQELSYWYVGPLLVVMPRGFGMYAGGRATTAEARVLRGLPHPGSTSTELTASAAAAVRGLVARRALVWKDTQAPQVAVYPAKAVPGRTVRLQYATYDDGGKTSERVEVLAGRRVLLRAAVPLHRIELGRRSSLDWQAPTREPDGALRLCVAATDASGNRARRCAAITLAS